MHIHNPIYRSLLHPVFLAACTFLSSCGNDDAQQVPNLKKVYSGAAEKHNIYTDPVIVIPGVLGSNLIHHKTKQNAWGVFHGDYLSPATPEGLKALALQPQNLPLNEHKSPLIPNGALQNFEYKLFGLTMEAKAYLHIMQTLGVGGFKDEALSPLTPDYDKEHFTCFQFGYDWRLSNAQNAAKLHDFILEKKRYINKEVKERYGKELSEIKFNIVAHSMGGILSRYYARYGNQPLPEEGLPELNWAGAEHINHLFLVSTPNSGSVVSMQELINGRKVPNKKLKRLAGFTMDDYPAELLGTFPSAYEMFPRERHFALVDQNWNKLDPLSLDLWKEQKWGLAGGDPTLLKQIISEGKTDEELQEIALKHLEKCMKNARQFQKAMDVPADRKPKHFKMSLYVGDAFYTAAQLKLYKQEGRLVPSIYKPGDETVLRSSVLADENIVNDDPKLDSPIPFDHVHFIFKKHIEMTEDIGFADNILFELLQR